MKGFNEKRFGCGHNDVDIDLYYTRDEVFGHFTEDGRAYVVERRDTPRDWLQYLCNSKVRSGVTNIGKGFLFHINGVKVTKQYETNGNYIDRNMTGERKIILEIDGKEHDYFLESDNFTCTVRPGYVVYNGDVENLHVEVCIFVPLKAPCECWMIKITNNGEKTVDIKLSAKLDVLKIAPLILDESKNEFITEVEDAELELRFVNIFKASKACGFDYSFYPVSYVEFVKQENVEYYHEIIKAEVSVAPNATEDWNIVSAACLNEEEREEIREFVKMDVCEKELEEVKAMWDKIFDFNYCHTPDKNFDNFLNVWLKNQMHITYHYDRGRRMTGYRDGMQDSWGYLLAADDPKKALRKVLYLLGFMYEDGRCPRGVHNQGTKHDLDDFCDAPIWIPIFLNSYVKETGDYAVLDKEVGFFNSDKTATVEDHIWRSLDYMYHSRGKNGLIRMRDGDWADGLTGINKYGEDATSAWVTVAAFHAQNLMAEVYEQIGDTAKAEELKKRSAEYKKIVNEVAWDGNWLVYAFFEDGEPIGSHKNLEGKIWLNVQAWGIFTGIIDDENKIKRISNAVARYLDTPYGAMVLYPPYVFYGQRCGRLMTQCPGMFLNASIYNHAASFKIFSDVKRGENDVAFDTFMRCLPNHPDCSDTRRTSEPFSVANVYYGPDHHRYGMNLFSYFTAVSAWLMHAGYEEILGVKPDFDGLKIEPCVPEDWNEYSVTKTYRGTKYNFKFVRSDEKSITVDGKKIDGNKVFSTNPVCEVEVKF